MTALQTITESISKGETNGGKLAKSLRTAGFSAAETKTALESMGYSVKEEDAVWGIVLHISSRIPANELERVMSGFGGGVEVAWHRKPDEIQAPSMAH